MFNNIRLLCRYIETQNADNIIKLAKKSYRKSKNLFDRKGYLRNSHKNKYQKNYNQ